jgi:hypothetical protein
MDNQNEDLKRSKKRRIIIIIIVVILLALFLAISLSSKSDDNENNLVGESNNNTDTLAEAGTEKDSLTPEQVIERLNREMGIGVEQGPISAEIIGPEGESFTPGQARHYQVQVLGLENGSRCSCDFKFYINENNEEYLYREMADRGCSRKAEIEGHNCGFTSTFIEKIGELRVHVDVEVEKQDEIVQTATADRMYIVK